MPRNREKLPISTPKNESNLTRYWDFCEKMWHLSKSKDVILIYKLTNIPKIAAPKGESQSPDEEKATFSQKYPKFLVKFDSFFGVESGSFLSRKSRQNICGLCRKVDSPQNLSRFFRKESATFDPKKQVEFKENLGF